MFVSQNRFEHAQREIEYLRRQIQELRWAHMRLLGELGYVEQKVIEHTKLVKKGGPERG